MATPLTPLGTRTLSGFKKKWGKQGQKKFDEAMKNGLIDRSKMENLGLTDPDADNDNDAGGMSTEDDSLDAAPPPPMMLSGPTPTPMPPRPMPSPMRPIVKGAKKKTIPVGLARGAPGMFQKRPG